MSITLKRPMFRMGGQAGSEDTGITSGLRQQYQVGRLVTDESSPYANYPYGVSENSYANPNLMGIGSAANMYNLLNNVVDKGAPDKNFVPKLDSEGKAEPVSLEDKINRIMKQYEVTSQDDLSSILGGIGAGFSGAYTLGEALNKAAQTRGQLIEPKIQRAQDIKAKLSLLPIEQQFQKELKGMETKGQIQFKERIVDNYIDGLIQQAKTPAEKTAIENNRIRLKFEYLVQGSDISDLLKISGSTQVLDLAKSQARKELKNMGVATSDPNYEKLLKELTIKNAAEYSQNLKKNVGSDLFRTEKADGGIMNEPIKQVEQQTQIEVSPPTTNNTQMLSYEELRNRLPKEISNDIVKLLSVSYQALGDFAEIATQSDVDKFNLKYGVNLVLPRGA
jgi:hypothetical protein